jgi:hypothetical protein
LRSLRATVSPIPELLPVIRTTTLMLLLAADNGGDLHLPSTGLLTYAEFHLNPTFLLADPDPRDDGDHQPTTPIAADAL